jgi:peptidoglycan/xylan/chitin deacetylase (PgdA/CDA1 family)
VRKTLRSLASTLLATIRTQDAPRVLYYHRVDEDDQRSCVRPEQFHNQLRYLSTSGRQILTLDDLYRSLEMGHSLPQRSIVLTFDDGFADNYIHAYPALRTFGFPATIFLTVGFIGASTLPVLSDTHRELLPLTWEQVNEMNRHGVSFGSHTLTHPSLPQLPGEEARREIYTSRLLLQEKLGHSIPFFCYPRGAVTPSIKEIVRQAGYTGACSVHPGPVRVKSDRFALPRTYIGRDDTLDDFHKKLCGAYDVLHAGVQLWRRFQS